MLCSYVNALKDQIVYCSDIILLVLIKIYKLFREQVELLDHQVTEATLGKEYVFCFLI